MHPKKFLFAIAFISIATAIGIAGYLYFANQKPVLAAGTTINAISCNQADVYLSQLLRQALGTP